MSEPGRRQRRPGFWHRGMSRRRQLIIVILSSLIVVGGLIYALASGIRFFCARRLAPWPPRSPRVCSGRS